jgi:2-polyprenyl-6-methoxyphenol hydroxylase-like FAD-dependent oxidoreductase
MSASQHRPVLIVGAGPTGLAAALFLTQRGVLVRIVDQALEPDLNSRALVVNPRSLELLEESGITKQLLAQGRPLLGALFHDEWKALAHVDFKDIDMPHPMLALTQAKTEAALTRHLEAAGVRIERGVTLVNFDNSDSGVTAHLRQGASIEEYRTPLMLAADGAKSLVRHNLAIEFEGSTFPEDWPLYDLHLETPLDCDHVQLSFIPGGLIFMLNIEGDLWRVFGNASNVLDHLPEGSKPGEITWKSSFHISHRLASSEAQQRVVLIGDAAHIHSPLGARGMNLGIEDGYEVAYATKAFLDGDLGAIERYAVHRHSVHSSVVERIKVMTTMARGQPSPVGAMRKFLLPGLTKFAPAAHQMLKTACGLDHLVVTGKQGN